jgi:hypothetical protein
MTDMVTKFKDKYGQTVTPIKVAVFYDGIGDEFMDFNIQEESQVSTIIREYNESGDYSLRFIEIKTDYEYSS